MPPATAPMPAPMAAALLLSPIRAPSPAPTAAPAPAPTAVLPPVPISFMLAHPATIATAPMQTATRPARIDIFMSFSLFHVLAAPKLSPLMLASAYRPGCYSLDQEGLF